MKPNSCIPRAIAPGAARSLRVLWPARANSRHGTFMIVVLVCLIVAGMLVASLLKLALLQDRQLDGEHCRAQAAWLADSGLERAAGRLASDPAYAGEIWNIDASRLGGPDGASVAIRIEKAKPDSEIRTIVVEAVYPADGPHQARLTRQAAITISKES